MKKCVSIHEIIRLIKWKIDPTDATWDINRPRPRPRLGHKCTTYKTSLSMMMLICIKQHVGNIWSSIHEKVKQYWGCV